MCVNSGMFFFPWCYVNTNGSIRGEKGSCSYVENLYCILC